MSPIEMFNKDFLTVQRDLGRIARENNKVSPRLELIRQLEKVANQKQPKDGE